MLFNTLKFFYLKGRIGKESLHLLAHSPRSRQPGLGRLKPEAKTFTKVSSIVTWVQVLGPSPPAFLSIWDGCWVLSGASGLELGTHWDAGAAGSGLTLYHNSGSTLCFLQCEHHYVSFCFKSVCKLTYSTLVMLKEPTTKFQSWSQSRLCQTCKSNSVSCKLSWQCKKFSSVVLALWLDLICKVVFHFIPN